MNNYNGVKFGTQPTDFIAGVNTPLGVDILNLNADWDTDRPEHEHQNKGYETSACTIFSGLDCLETVFMFFLKNNLFPPDLTLWLRANGYFNNGFINFSDRYSAQFAEIEPLSGTYQYKAGNALRQGLIPETMFPYTTDNYYNNKAITAEMTALAEEFIKRFTVNWYWVENISIGLHSSPLQGIVKYADGTGILKPEGRLNHAIMVYGQADDYLKIDDSYSIREKKYGKDFVFSFMGFSLTINNNNMINETFIKENDLKFVRNKNTGQFGRIMQGKLRVVASTDRGTLLLLDNEHRANGVTIANDLWLKLPQTNF